MTLKLHCLCLSSEKLGLANIFTLILKNRLDIEVLPSIEMFLKIHEHFGHRFF